MEELEEVLEARAMSLVENHEALLHDLVALREKHGLSQEVVAERMGISQPAVAKFERYDANPRLSTLRRYAMAVGARLCDVVLDDYLLEHSGQQWRPSAHTWTSLNMRPARTSPPGAWRSSVDQKVGV